MASGNISQAFLAGFRAVDQLETNRQQRKFAEEEQSFQRKVWNYTEGTMKDLELQRQQNKNMAALEAAQSHISQEAHTQALQAAEKAKAAGGDSDAAYFDSMKANGLSPYSTPKEKEGMQNRTFNWINKNYPGTMEMFLLAHNRDPAAGPHVIDRAHPVTRVGLVPEAANPFKNPAMWAEVGTANGGAPMTDRRSNSGDDPVDYVEFNSAAMMRWVGAENWNKSPLALVGYWRSLLDANERDGGYTAPNPADTDPSKKQNVVAGANRQVSNTTSTPAPEQPTSTQQQPTSTQQQPTSTQQQMYDQFSEEIRERARAAGGGTDVAPTGGGNKESNIDPTLVGILNEIDPSILAPRPAPTPGANRLAADLAAANEIRNRFAQSNNLPARTGLEPTVNAPFDPRAGFELPWMAEPTSSRVAGLTGIPGGIKANQAFANKSAVERAEYLDALKNSPRKLALLELHAELTAAEADAANGIRPPERAPGSNTPTGVPSARGTEQYAGGFKDRDVAAPEAPGAPEAPEAPGEWFRLKAPEAPEAPALPWMTEANKQAAERAKRGTNLPVHLADVFPETIRRSSAAEDLVSEGWPEFYKERGLAGGIGGLGYRIIETFSGLATDVKNDLGASLEKEYILNSPNMRSINEFFVGTEGWGNSTNEEVLAPTTPTESPSNTKEVNDAAGDKASTLSRNTVINDPAASRGVAGAPQTIEGAMNATNTTTTASQSRRKILYPHEIFAAAKLRDAKWISDETFQQFVMTGRLSSPVETDIKVVGDALAIVRTNSNGAVGVEWAPNPYASAGSGTDEDRFDYTTKLLEGFFTDKEGDVDKPRLRRFVQRVHTGALQIADITGHTPKINQTFINDMHDGYSFVRNAADPRPWWSPAKWIDKLTGQEELIDRAAMVGYIGVKVANITNQPEFNRYYGSAGDLYEYWEKQNVQSESWKTKRLATLANAQAKTGANWRDIVSCEIDPSQAKCKLIFSKKGK